MICSQTPLLGIEILSLKGFDGLLLIPVATFIQEEGERLCQD